MWTQRNPRAERSAGRSQRDAARETPGRRRAIGAPLPALTALAVLGLLVACAGVTLRAVAAALGIEVRGGRVSAEGDLDFRGTLGVDKEAPVGFRDIRLAFDLDTDADADSLATLFKLTERYCVIYQTLRNPPPIALDRR